MDVVSGAGRVMVLTAHLTKTGAPKLVAACDRPLTGRAVVRRVITDWASSTWPTVPESSS